MLSPCAAPVPSPAAPSPPFSAPRRTGAGLPQPRSLGGTAGHGTTLPVRRRAFLHDSTVRALIPGALSFFLESLCLGCYGERRRSRGAGELLTCAHPRGGGAGARRGRGAGPALLRWLPRGLGHLRAGRCERRPRRHGGRDPRPGAGAHRAAAAEPLPRRWEPRARADAEPRGAGVGTGGGGEKLRR